jgi:hypothetical protein
MRETMDDLDHFGEGPPPPPDMSKTRSRVVSILFRMFTLLEFGFLGFILFDLFRKYIITGNLDWWKK